MAIISLPQDGSVLNYCEKFGKGGKVARYTQPPIRCGFFMPAILGDCTFLPGVVSYIKPATGKARSASFDAFNGPRKSYDFQHIKQFKGNNDMQIANQHATGAPAPMIKGLTYPPSHNNPNPRCLLNSNTLLNALLRAKAKERREERGAAYHELLQEFHRLIIPAFILEGGSISKASHLLGLHRETLSRYIDVAGIDMNSRAGGAA